MAGLLTRKTRMARVAITVSEGWLTNSGVDGEASGWDEAERLMKEHFWRLSRDNVPTYTWIEWDGESQAALPEE